MAYSAVRPCLDNDDTTPERPQPERYSGARHRSGPRRADGCRSALGLWRVGRHRGPDAVAGSQIPDGGQVRPQPHQRRRPVRRGLRRHAARLRARTLRVRPARGHAVGHRPGPGGVRRLHRARLSRRDEGVAAAARVAASAGRQRRAATHAVALGRLARWPHRVRDARGPARGRGRCGHPRPGRGQLASAGQ